MYVPKVHVGQVHVTMIAIQDRIWTDMTEVLNMAYDVIDFGKVVAEVRFQSGMPRRECRNVPPFGKLIGSKYGTCQGDPGFLVACLVP